MKKAWAAITVVAGGGAAVVALAGCNSAQPRPAAAVASAPATRTVTPVPTVTVTQQAPVPKVVVVSPSQAPAPAPDPADVVREFYADLNSGDFAAAWALGGDNIAGTDYASWVAGYVSTVAVHGVATDAGGGVVDVQFGAVQSDGSVKTYGGTYTVSDGVIVAADVTQTDCERGLGARSRSLLGLEKLSLRVAAGTVSRSGPGAGSGALALGREQHEPRDRAGECDRCDHPRRPLVGGERAAGRVGGAEHCDQRGHPDRKPNLAQHVDNRRAGRERVRGQRRCTRRHQRRQRQANADPGKNHPAEHLPGVVRTQAHDQRPPGDAGGEDGRACGHHRPRSQPGGQPPGGEEGEHRHHDRSWRYRQARDQR